jgi:hypothetical protein
VGLALALGLFMQTTHSSAHPLGFGTAEVHLTSTRLRIEVVIDAPTDTAVDDRRRLELEARSRQGLVASFDGQPIEMVLRVLALGEGPSAVDVVEFDGRVPVGAEFFTLTSSDAIGDLSVDVRSGGRPVHDALLTAGQSTPALSLRVAPPADGASSTLSALATSQGEPVAAPALDTQRSETAQVSSPRAPGFASGLLARLDLALLVFGAAVTRRSARRTALEAGVFVTSAAITSLSVRLVAEVASPDWASPALGLLTAALGLESLRAGPLPQQRAGRGVALALGGMLAGLLLFGRWGPIGGDSPAPALEHTVGVGVAVLGSVALGYALTSRRIDEPGREAHARFLWAGFLVAAGVGVLLWGLVPGA